MNKIRVGMWRDDAEGPMQVVSGPLGHESIHYEAPSAKLLDDEMGAFINWFNNEADTDPVLKSGIAHLWFLSIHPFDDGNGRIARAIADMLLARSEHSGQRFYSMSAQIQEGRTSYYDMLEDAQKGTLDITEPLMWFLDCMDGAFDNAERILADVFHKDRFWKSCAGLPLTDRQRLMLSKLLDGYDGKITSTNWADLAKCSQDTASRDIEDLVNCGIMIKNPAGGRSTSYSLTAEVSDDSVAARKQRLTRARELSEKISKQTRAAGITSKELENRAYSAFGEIKKEREGMLSGNDTPE
jgi:Fic family protein